jgi:glycosyltransferase involved in cell wall biosynthesis
VPVITSKTVGAADLVGDEAGIVLDDPDEVEPLAAAMRALAADGERRLQMGAAGRRIAAGYTWNRMGAAYGALFSDIVDVRPTSPAMAVVR